MSEPHIFPSIVQTANIFYSSSVASVGTAQIHNLSIVNVKTAYFVPSIECHKSNIPNQLSVENNKTTNIFALFESCNYTYFTSVESQK